jgi:hypothetical protein
MYMSLCRIGTLLIGPTVIIKLTRRRKGGIGDRGIRGEMVGNGGFDGIVLFLNLTLYTFRCTVPPTVALLNNKKG